MVIVSEFYIIILDNRAYIWLQRGHIYPLKSIFSFISDIYANSEAEK